jgi:hypothetical protein
VVAYMLKAVTDERVSRSAQEQLAAQGARQGVGAVSQVRGGERCLPSS